MRKFIISIICALCVGAAFAAGENVATSKAFVDTAVALKQDKIPANSGTAQVLTNTGGQGTVGTKEIYDSSAAYAGQKDSLVDAQTMNAGVQNAIDAEFRCIKWVDDDQTKDCLLVEIRSISSQTTLPAGYTALEYIESDGGQRINTGVHGLNTGDWKIYVKWMITGTQTQTYPMICGTYDDEYTNTYRIILNQLNPQSYFLYGDCRALNGLIEWRSFNGAMNQIHTGLMERDSVTFDGIKHTGCNIKGSTISASSDIYLFGYSIDAAGRPIGRLYHSWATKDGVYQYNAIPARRDSDGEIGMYDTVSNTFLTNDGTGDFVAGPDAGVYMP